MIRIQGLSKKYGNVTALAGIDLHIEAGTCFGLVGTNGAGRTTLLNILATLSLPTSGRIEMCGLDVRRQPLEVRRRLGYVAEWQPYFAETLRVQEYLEIIAAAHRMEAHRKAGAIAAVQAWSTLGLDDDIHTLSRGFLQQLALAVALLHEPSVLLLDEPLVYLDPLVRNRVRALLRTVQEHGTTIVFACNDTHEVHMLCSRVGVLHHGRLVEVVDMTAGGVDLTAVLATCGGEQTVDDNAGSAS